MKKIIAILTALAVVSMAFAQTVSISNTLFTNPSVTVDGSKLAWGFTPEHALREQIDGTASTADGRATVWARARLDLDLLDNANSSILSVTPRWKFTNDLTAAAVIKPIDSIEIKVGNRDNLNRWFGPSIAWYNSTHPYLTWTGNEKDLKGISGSWENIHGFRSGAYVGFTGVEGLYVGAGVAVDNWPVAANYNSTEGGSWIKKGAFGPFQAGATYDTDLFGVGAKWVGEFGGANKGIADTDAKYSAHNIYAGFTFKGLQDAKVGTTIGAAVDFDTHKNSGVMNTKAYTAFAVSANADMNFRNGITDGVAVTVGYVNADGKKSKVLPFYIGNTLGYKVSDDASFSLYTAYQQGGLEKAMKENTAKTDSSLVVLKPAFTFSMGASTFNFGVETAVVNQLKYTAKTDKEWAYTSLYGKAAVVQFPISWTYTF